MSDFPFFLSWIRKGKWYDRFLRKKKENSPIRNVSPVIRRVGKPMVFSPASRVSERN